ncbi:hypothetical protein JG687_00013192 [Phytophthora cactorum]|uniref:Uncharacterized protein n=1 Tax=Phytophthora cactorum TaxID=29920 RepID=A0A8T1TZZ5_9STRA|nr:hypothetical protein JG687_00013192 [Phytophthora cactorum]
MQHGLKTACDVLKARFSWSLASYKDMLSDSQQQRSRNTLTTRKLRLRFIFCALQAGIVRLAPPWVWHGVT